MSKWNRLDLRDKTKSPREGELTAIRMEPKTGQAKFYRSERYDIGCFIVEDKKVWWRSTVGTTNPTTLKKHYDIWWCSIPAFDGI